MKNTGIVRRLDELGRVVLPKELRDTMGLENRARIEIHVDADAIVLKKYNPKVMECAICHSEKNLTEVNGKYLCLSCLYQGMRNAKPVNEI